MTVCDVTDAQTLRLVAAYGLRYGALATGTADMAAKLWARGWSMRSICEELELTSSQLGHIIHRNRHMFPYRKGNRERKSGK